MTQEIVESNNRRIRALQKQLEEFVAYEQSFIEGLPKSCLPPDWSPLPVPGALTKLLKHLLTQEILKSIHFQKAFRFWFRFALIEFVTILLLVAIVLLKS